MNDSHSEEARTWAMAAHLAGFCGFLVPFGSIIGPLVVWLIKKDEMPFVDDQGKEALNFQITVAIAGVVFGFLTIVLIGIPLLLALIVYDVVMIVIAAIKAKDGETYRYPFTLRLVT